MENTTHPDGAQPVLAAPDTTTAPGGPMKARRWPALATLGAIILTAVTVTALVAGDNNAVAYSLETASANASAASRVAFDMQMETAGETLQIYSRVDLDKQLAAVDMSIPGDSTSEKVETILDLDRQVLYMNAATLGEAVDVDTDWVAIDLGVVPGMQEQLAAVTDASPLEMASLFEKAASVVDKGSEELNGEQVRHYLVSVDTDEVLAAQPSLFASLEDVAVDLPGTIEYDVWVTQTNELRKLGFSTELDGEKVAVTMTVRAIGTIEPIVTPDIADVTDLSNLLKS